MLEQVKLALRLVTDIFDGEVNDLIEAAYDDLEIAGVQARENATAPLIRRAVTTYCKANFGAPDEYDRLKAASGSHWTRSRRGLSKPAVGFANRLIPT